MKRTTHTFSILVLLVTFLASGWYLYAHREWLTVLADISWRQFLGLMSIRVLFIGLNGVLLKLLAARFQVQLRFTEWFGLAFVTALFNYLIPFSGGMLVRATYLKIRHNIPYAQFASWLAATYLIIFLVTSLIGMGLTANLAQNVSSAIILLAMFATMALFLTAVLILPSFHFPERNRLFKTANVALDGWRVIKNDSRLLLQMVLYTVVSFALNGLSFWYAFTILGIEIKPAAAFIVSMSGIYAVVISLTPGNFGIQEAGATLLAGMVGSGLGEGLLVVLLIRLATMLPIIILGLIFTYRLAQYLGDYSFLRPTKRKQLV
ncbi:MAG: flippase-like domain-containing protein [Chloroflexi bacterium]|nr:flippase-like domain-containing protein [Chloroflexota bacterium]